MAGYTKGDYNGAYRVAPTDPKTGIKFSHARHPDFPGEEISFYLHYHPYVWKPVKFNKAQWMKENGYIKNMDRLIVLGSGFNWLGEGIEALNPTVKTCGIDPSDYVQIVKDESPNDELVECIRAAGYEWDDEYVGAYLYDLYKDDTPRAKTPIVHGDMMYEDDAYDEVVSIIGVPNKIVVDEIWQTLSMEDKDHLRGRFDNLNLQVYFVIDGVVSE